MSDLDLPTYDELRSLYETKGKEALIWYAWRNSLRAFSVLSFVSLEAIWEHDTFYYFFKIAKPLFALSVTRNSNYYKKAIEDTAVSAQKSNQDAVNNICASINATLHALVYDNTINSVCYSAITAYVAINNYIDDNIIADSFARLDFEYLNSRKIFSWDFIPLWSENDNFLSKNYVEKLEEELINLGVDWLCLEIKTLLNLNKGIIPFYWDNFAENILDDTVKSINLLKDSIYYGLGNVNVNRIILLGSGGVGKSTLVDRLLDRPVEVYKPVTVGINYLNYNQLHIGSYQENFKNFDIRDSFEISIWDFGGQTIFYNLHKIFLNESSIYILVIDSRKETVPTMWLNQLKVLNNNILPTNLFIVINEYENCINPLNEKSLKRNYGDGLKFFYFPCNDPNHIGLDNFKKSLLNTLHENPYKTSKKLLEFSEQINKLAEQKPLINQYDLKKHCEKFFSKTYTNEILKKLEDLGKIVPLYENKKKYCINPIWVVDYAYRILYIYELRSANGYMERNKLIECAYEYFINSFPTIEFTIDYLNELIDFLLNSKICIEIKSSLFFPSLAIANEPDSVQALLESNCYVLLEFYLPYFLYDLPSKLIEIWLCEDENLAFISEVNDIWKDGFILSYNPKLIQNDASYLETIELRSDFFINNNKHIETKMVVFYKIRESAISCFCYGDNKSLSELIVKFWSGLSKAIRPTREVDIKPMIKINQNYFNLIDYGKKPLVELTTYLNDPQAMMKILERNMSGNTYNTTNINGNLVNSAMNTGNNNTLNNSVFNQQFNAQQQALLLETLEYLRKNSDLSTSEFEKLIALKKQVETNQINDSIYQKLLPHLSTAANLAAIVPVVVDFIKNFTF